MTKMIFGRIVICFLVLLFSVFGVFAQHTEVSDKAAVPFVGAQVFIEPGQTAEEIDVWFRLLKDHKMPICRIRMFEAYMRDAAGNWDFTLFDHAFKAADKHGVKIFGTVFPYTEKTDIGGFKFPTDESHLQRVADFIKALTMHFGKYSSLYGWVIINEPGIGNVRWNDLSKQKYDEWKLKNPAKDFTEKGYPVLMDMQEKAFLMDYNTWYIGWLANEIKKYDPWHEIHVNNHAMFQNLAEYDFPEWRKFLTSLGGSAHASWHFGYFTRPQYALAMSANSEIVRSGAGNIPWLMTELQGGNNTYSGGVPMCPTKEEIAQWLWIVTATEGAGSIFWSLNPRSSGIEAGEWALLDFQNKPTDRMMAAAKVAEVLQANADIFKNAREVDSGINLLYIRESIWAESLMATGGEHDFVARKPGGIMKSMLGYFSAISEMGINASIKEFGEFDFSKPDYTGVTIVLAHQIAVPDKYAPLLQQFVNKGGKLIVDGLTAFFDENLHNTMKTGFTFENVFGGNISEFKLIGNLFDIKLKDNVLPAHLWQGYLTDTKGEVLATTNGKVVASKYKYGNGEVVWMPSLVGLGSWLTDSNDALVKFLNKEVPATAPIKFSSINKDVLMKTMRAGNVLISVIINKSGAAKNIALKIENGALKPTVLFADKQGKIDGKTVKINAEETIVLTWK